MLTCSTISLTNAWKDVLAGSHPKTLFALSGFPLRYSTSEGRKYLGSIRTTTFPELSQMPCESWENMIGHTGSIIHTTSFTPCPCHNKRMPTSANAFKDITNREISRRALKPYPLAKLPHAVCLPSRNDKIFRLTSYGLSTAQILTTLEPLTLSCCNIFHMHST